MPTKKKLTKTNKKLKFANISSRKKVLLITIFALVAIGAGIIIRSFAATANYDYTVANGFLNASSGSEIKPEPGKNGLQVVEIQPGGNALVLKSPQAFAISQGQLYRLCVKSNNLPIQIDLINDNGTLYKSTNLVDGTANDRDPAASSDVGGGYKESCSFIQPTNGGFRGRAILYNKSVHVIAKHTNLYNGLASSTTPGDPIKVSAFTLKFVDSPYTPSGK